MKSHLHFQYKSVNKEIIISNKGDLLGSGMLMIEELYFGNILLHQPNAKKVFLSRSAMSAISES